LGALEQSEPFIGGELGHPVVGGHGPKAPALLCHIPATHEKAGRHSGKGSVPKVQAGSPPHGVPAAGGWDGQPGDAPPLPEALDDACAVELVPAPPAPEVVPVD
jgi:hypothetical protein